MSKYKYIYANDNEEVVVEDYESNDVVAYIVPNADKISWRLVKVCEDVEIHVNGDKVHLVYYLSLGDKIKIANNEQYYVFDKKKENYNSEIIVSLKKQKWTIAAIFVMMLLVVSYIVIERNVIDPEDDIRKSEVMEYAGSVFKIIVEDVYYQEIHKTKNGDSIRIIDSLKFKNEIPSGTAFLCEDGKIVTARHCIEPWLVLKDPLSAYKSDDKCVRWASDAESFNVRNIRNNNDSIYRKLKTIFKIQNSDVTYRFSSDSCYYYICNDNVTNISSPTDPLFWRSLGNYDDKSSLGDIVYISSAFKGKIKIADSSLTDSLNIDYPAVHLGYLADKRQFDFERSRLSDTFDHNRCIRFKDTDVDKGFSGGPALVRYKGKLYAVGVLSRKNDTENRVCYCVPITIINKMTRRWIE